MRTPQSEEQQSLPSLCPLAPHRAALPRERSCRRRPCRQVASPQACRCPRVCPSTRGRRAVPHASLFHSPLATEVRRVRLARRRVLARLLLAAVRPLRRRGRRPPRAPPPWAPPHTTEAFRSPTLAPPLPRRPWSLEMFLVRLESSFPLTHPL